MVKVRKKKTSDNICDISLLIETSDEILPWDNTDLAKSIMEEVEIAESTARAIAEKVKNKIKEVAETMEWDTVPTSLIREFVSNEIIAGGKRYKKKATKYNEIGLSAKEIRSIVEGSGAGENSNISSHNPEAINFNIAEIVTKKYAFQEVFSDEVVKAHMEGKIHVHDLGQIFKFYCGSHSIQYIIKNGLKLPTVRTQSFSPKHVDTLTNCICTYVCSVAQIFAGAVGLADVNSAYAPFLVGLSEKEMKQAAQSLIYSLAQTGFSRGGQTLFLDMNLTISTPTYLTDTPAIGPKGKYYKLVKTESGDALIETTKDKASTYTDYEPYAQKFLIQMMKILEAGDKNGLTFMFPKANVHFDDNSFLEKNKEVADSVFSCAAKNGGVYFLFDRNGESSVSQCCRLKLNLTEEQLQTLKMNPEDSRFAALQNVTISLPNAAIEAVSALDKKATSDEKIALMISKMKEYMDVAILAHSQKYRYIKHLYGLPNSPLRYAKNGMDGKPYVRMDDLSYLIGISGLDNAVYAVTGEHLHESKKALKTGIYIIAEMRAYCDELKGRHRMKLSLEETPGESSNGRLCQTSIRNHGDFARSIACAGDSKNPYWNNSVHYDYAADVNFIQRIADQSKFHSMIDAGAIIHLWVGENLPDKDSIRNIVYKTLVKTQCSQMTISPEFTICNDCNHTELGTHEECYSCKTKNVCHLTRVVGYNSIVQNWSDSKKEEFKTRNRKVGYADSV